MSTDRSEGLVVLGIDFLCRLNFWMMCPFFCLFFVLSLGPLAIGFEGEERGRGGEGVVQFAGVVACLILLVESTMGCCRMCGWM